jgi:hypothetical protein
MVSATIEAAVAAINTCQLSTMTCWDWPIVRRELARCVELRRAMIQARWFN